MHTIAISMYHVHLYLSMFIYFQLFRLNEKGQMAVGERCVDATGGGISIIYCPVQPTGPWQLDQVRYLSNLFKWFVFFKWYLSLKIGMLPEVWCCCIHICSWLQGIIFICSVVQIKPLNQVHFLSPPVRMHGGLLCIVFCMYVCLWLDQNSD